MRTHIIIKYATINIMISSEILINNHNPVLKENMTTILSPILHF